MATGVTVYENTLFSQGIYCSKIILYNIAILSIYLFILAVIVPAGKGKLFYSHYVKVQPLSTFKSYGTRMSFLVLFFALFREKESIDLFQRMKAILQLFLHQEEEGAVLLESNAWRLQCGKTKVKLSNGLSGTILRKLCWTCTRSHLLE